MEDNDTSLKFKKNKTLHASIRDGVSYAVMMGAGENYVGPFGIFLKATTLQVGFLSTIPQLFFAVMQFVGARTISYFKDRRRVVFSGALAQACTWVPIALLPFIFGINTTSVLFLIGLVTFHRGANGITVPVWSSLVGDLISPEIRGRFFGHRNRLAGMSSFISLLLAGGILHLFETRKSAEYGYLIIFLVAFLARLDSAKWIGRYDNPVFEIKPEDDFTFLQFIRRSPQSNFAQFVFYVGVVNIAVSFSGPYFALYMLRDLQFSYMEFTIVSAISTITQFLTVRYWGEISDRFGNRKILGLCGWFIAAIPTLWLVSTRIWWIAIVQMCAGFIWAGFGLATGNFLFDAVTPPKRALCVAYQSLVNGVCVFIGSTAGGYVSTRLPAAYHLGSFVWHPISPLPVIFVMSGVMRLVASSLLLKRFKEVRPVEPIGNRELMVRIIHLKPIAGATFNFISGFFRGQNGSGSKKENHFEEKNDNLSN